jgi:hypothetical protein
MLIPFPPLFLGELVADGLPLAALRPHLTDFLDGPDECRIDLVLRKVRGADHCDPQSASLGKGIVVGPEKREVPVVLRLLPLDHLLDLRSGELLARIFLAIGHDHENDQPRSIGFGHLGQVVTLGHNRNSRRLILWVPSPLCNSFPP